MPYCLCCKPKQKVTFSEKLPSYKKETKYLLEDVKAAKTQRKQLDAFKALAYARTAARVAAQAEAVAKAAIVNIKPKLIKKLRPKLRGRLNERLEP